MITFKVYNINYVSLTHSRLEVPQQACGPQSFGHEWPRRVCVKNERRKYLYNKNSTVIDEKRYEKKIILDIHKNRHRFLHKFIICIHYECDFLLWTDMQVLWWLDRY